MEMGICIKLMRTITSRIPSAKGAAEFLSRLRVRRHQTYEPSAGLSFGNLFWSAAYLSLAFLKEEPSSMYFRC
jgi:hypothetical protein